MFALLSILGINPRAWRTPQPNRPHFWGIPRSVGCPKHTAQKKIFFLQLAPKLKTRRYQQTGKNNRTRKNNESYESVAFQVTYICWEDQKTVEVEAKTNCHRFEGLTTPVQTVVKFTNLTPFDWSAPSGCRTKSILRCRASDPRLMQINRRKWVLKNLACQSGRGRGFLTRVQIFGTLTTKSTTMPMRWQPQFKPLFLCGFSKQFIR